MAKAWRRKYRRTLTYIDAQCGDCGTVFVSKWFFDCPNCGGHELRDLGGE